MLQGSSRRTNPRVATVWHTFPLDIPITDISPGYIREENLSNPKPNYSHN